MHARDFSSRSFPAPPRAVQVHRRPVHRAHARHGVQHLPLPPQRSLQGAGAWPLPTPHATPDAHVPHASDPTSDPTRRRLGYRRCTRCSHWPSRRRLRNLPRNSRAIPAQFGAQFSDGPSPPAAAAGEDAQREQARALRAGEARAVQGARRVAGAGRPLRALRPRPPARRRGGAAAVVLPLPGATTRALSLASIALKRALRLTALPPSLCASAARRSTRCSTRTATSASRAAIPSSAPSSRSRVRRATAPPPALPPAAAPRGTASECTQSARPSAPRRPLRARARDLARGGADAPPPRRAAEGAEARQGPRQPVGEQRPRRQRALARRRRRARPERLAL